MKKIILLASLISLSCVAFAKLPAAALNDEAKLKAAEAAAKTAHGTKVANFQLCKSMDKAAAHYYKSAKASGKEAKSAVETPACADPGAFVFPPPAAPAVAAPATVAVPAAAAGAVPPAAVAAAKPAVAPSASAAPVKK